MDVDKEMWEFLRDLEKRLIALDSQVVRLHESNHQLQRINGFIFGALLMELAVMLFGSI